MSGQTLPREITNIIAEQIREGVLPSMLALKYRVPRSVIDYISGHYDKRTGGLLP